MAEAIGPARFGLNPQQSPTTATSELHALATPSQAGKDVSGLLSPSNPLFVFGVIGLVTFGAMAFSTTVKGPGHSKVSLKVGD